MQEFQEFVLLRLKMLATDFGVNLLAALIILVLGYWGAKIIKKVLRKVLGRGKMDPTLISFISNMIYALVLAFVAISSLSRLGIQTASLVAVLGAAGLAVGLALQGSLANFAAGVLMIIFRPFKVGDRVQAAGVDGIVDEIDILTTQLKTPDNKVIIIPNSKITDGHIINFTTNPQLRVDLVFGVSYSDDIDKVKVVIEDYLANDPRVLKNPAPMVRVLALSNSSVDFVVRPWVKGADYWDVYFDTTENLKKRFDAEGISIPFPQRDVHIYQMDAK
ncbi:MAG: mechanosensitive ion channel [Desulfatibacillaceae bacterium]|nr:mechanosensitive ion channel [Desulfatibacillaceae bacterium]